MKKRVAILGGGIGGLSAAHELADHFEVHVYEAGRGVGGKARSQFKQRTGTGGRADLPGEHGFRFFPAFYRHIVDTMQRIPTAGGGNVAENLIGCDEMAIAEVRRGARVLPRRRPEGVGDFFKIVNTVEEFFAGVEIRTGDIARFAAKMLTYLCSCDARRFGQYEELSFWRYIEGDRYSPQFQSYINSSRFMVAMDARRGSARSIANKAIQMFLDFRRARGQNDRVLNGPTTSQWLTPWENHLSSKGVQFHFEEALTGFDYDGARITGARLNGASALVEADYYVLAVPLERVKGCISDAIAAADDSLHRLVHAPDMTAWMVGAQFYLGEDVPICSGHVAYPDSPWALSAISQAQFWTPAGGPIEQRYGDGRVKGILSVDICDWTRPGAYTPKSAAECQSEEEVLAEVWRQLKDGLNGRGQVLHDDNRVDWRLDQNIEFGPGGAMNPTPLLIHPPRSWRSRPQATTKIPNLMLAADYVQTTTDLATMEGANEAARMAANGIFSDAGLPARASLWPLREEAGRLVEVAKKLDEQRWDDALDATFGDLSTSESFTLEEVKERQDRFMEELRERAGTML